MINPEIQARLRANYNPEGSDLRALQLKMLSMLISVDKICRENKIKYWLSSGTCLGAYRHGGFIPWDDDVDIEMLEKDYKKFCSVMQNNSDYGIVFQTTENDPGYNLSFGKIRDVHSTVKEVHDLDMFYKYKGIFIDVFSLIPTNSLVFSKLGHYMKRIELKLKYKMMRTGGYRSVYYVLKGLNNLILPLLKIGLSFRSFGNLRHEFGNCFLSLRNINDIFPLKYMQFEGYDFPVPRDTDSYLRKIYGNGYDSLPKLSKIEVHMNEFTLM